MALLWMDGFDHYGSPSVMLDGVWAEVNSSDYTISSVNPRTGGSCLRAPGGASTSLRRVLGGPKTKVGVGLAMYLSALPVADNRLAIVSFRSSGNSIQVWAVCESTGIIRVYRGGSPGSGGGTSLGATAAPALVAGAYQHFEMAVNFSNTAGTVEIRVNGVTVLSLSSVDTVATATEECSQVAFLHSYFANPGVSVDMDDVFVWDGTGTENNDFLGDRRVRTLFPNGNTASAGWTAVGAASGYQCIDEAAPNDETDYIEAIGGTTPVSEFEFEDLPAVGAVAAVQTYVRARKTNAGAANLQASLVSGASVDAGTDRPITEAYTYYTDVSELDPATGTPWTQSAVNAAKLRLARTA